jgi:hypothetical protein
MTKLTNSKKISPFAETMLNMIEPLVNALDNNPNFINDASTDTGHARRSQSDKGIRIMLDSLIRPIHRQLKGYTTQSGTKIDGLHVRMTEVETRMQQHYDKYQGREEDMTLDAQTYRLASWFQETEARLNWMMEMYNGLQEAYLTVTGEQWTYTELATNGGAVKPATTDKSKADIAALFAKAGQRTLIKNAAAAPSHPTK